VQRVVAEHLENGIVVRELIERPSPLTSTPIESSGKPRPGDR
jgi:hypothetical protein